VVADVRRGLAAAAPAQRLMLGGALAAMAAGVRVPAPLASGALSSPAEAVHLRRAAWTGGGSW
jgi:hypothetical protein